jgi:hypothetical protein
MRRRKKDNKSNRADGEPVEDRRRGVMEEGKYDWEVEGGDIKREGGAFTYQALPPTSTTLGDWCLLLFLLRSQPD